MRVRFWGTRGSVPAPGPETLRYGGNTSSLQVTLNDGTLLLFDCGTGARKLGLALARQGPARIHLFVGHTHSDHIQGLPFFLPAFMAGSHITVYGPVGIDRSFPSAISGQMDYAYFPVPIHDLPARLEFVELGEGEFSVGRARLRTQYLNHTSPCLGYRVEVGGATLVYATDHEPHAVPYWRPERPANAYAAPELLHPADARHAAFLAGADLVIHDTQYTLAEYPQKVGWGHSPVEYAVDLALAAQAKRLALFHHDPTRDDAAVDALLLGCQAHVAETGRSLEVFAAAEGLELFLPERARRTAPEPDTLVPPSAAQRARLLIAEDDDSVAYTLEAVLTEDGHDVRRAATGTEAVRLATTDRFDLILLDLQLPELDGFEVARRLRADPATAATPILVLTAHGDQSTIETSFAQGITDFMTKPFAVAQLRARVHSWLTRAEAAERTPAPAR